MDEFKTLIENAENDYDREELKEKISKYDKSIISRYEKSKFFAEMVKFIVDYYMNSENYENVTAQAALLAFADSSDMDEIIIRIAKNYSLETKYIASLIRSFDDISDARTILKELMNWNENSSYGTVAQIILNAFEYTLTQPDLDYLIFEAELNELRSTDGDTSISDFLREKETEGKYAPVPKWVSLKEGENNSFLSTVSTGKSINEVETVFEDFIQEGKGFISSVRFEGDKDEDFEPSYDQEKEVFVLSKPILDVEDAINTFLSALGSREILEGNLETVNLEFRVWGPENRFSDRDCCSGPEVEKDGIFQSTGPCRMLQCECREYDPDLEFQEYDGSTQWFTGSCDNCKLKILDLSHAVRFPVKHGGWKGCYCSFECMKINPPCPEVSPEEKLSVIRIKKELNEIGIMDRSML